ncbi:hypothetical protein E2C01_022916 [Portunus trituberculatus]|uniref:Uncharacterized protein n=1 Tax=Portunus trituberculatus TaxID=210409 RepID=A0A5B7E6M9_PORTR|nr:hypothetical protein [Portunus trituberculatus]
MRRKAFNSTLSNKTMDKALVQSNWRDEQNWRRRLRTPNFIEAVLERDEM